jgi:hypothetical protein
MGLFSRSVPPRPGSPSPAARLRDAKGDALVPLVFPNQEGLAEAMGELSGDDPILHQLCLQLGFDQWPQARAAISALGKVPRVSAGTAPAVAAFLVATWPTGPDGYAWYGLNEAAMLLEKQAIELQKQAVMGIPSAQRVHGLLVGPALDGLLALARPPLHVAHRALSSLLVTLGPGDARVRLALMALLEAPVPSDDAGWHNHSRAEILRHLVAHFPPQAPTLQAPPPPPVSPARPSDAAPSPDDPTQATTERLIATLCRDVASGDPGRARVALDVAQQVPGATAALLPLLPALIESPGLGLDSVGASVRERALRLMGAALSAQARPDAAGLPTVLDEDEYWDKDAEHPSPASGATQQALARLLDLALNAPEWELRVAALDGLGALLPASALAIQQAVDAALASEHLPLKLRGVGWLVELARRG